MNQSAIAKKNKQLQKSLYNQERAHGGGKEAADSSIRPPSGNALNRTSQSVIKRGDTKLILGNAQNSQNTHSTIA